MMAPTDICRIIASGRYDLSSEKAVQAGMHGVLAAAFGEAVRREHRLSSADIPDFMVGPVAIEVKVRGARPVAVWKQLCRYAAHAEVEALILVTGRTMGLPPAIGGKPVWYVPLGRAWL